MRVLLLLLLATTTCFAADLDKAKTYRSNGMLEDAKRELVEVAYAAESNADERAEALLLLGDIGLEQGKPQVANENWAQVIHLHPTSRFAALANQKMSGASAVSTLEGHSAPGSGTIVLVVSDPNHPWAAGPLSAPLASPATLFDGSLSQAIQAARQQPNITGILEISLVTDSAFESGRVSCYRPNGASVWVEKVMFNIGGGAERIARRFADALAKKISGKVCP